MMIEKIYIPQLLKMSKHKQEIKLNDEIPHLSTLTPIRGAIIISHHGTFLQVELSVDTIITLTCDRCLQTFNHRLQVETSEIIWLSYQLDQDLNIPLEKEICQDDLSESLPPDGYFIVPDWIYEQLSLSMPLRQLCGKSCQAPIKQNREDETVIDNRWSALASLKSLIQE